MRKLLVLFTLFVVFAFFIGLGNDISTGASIEPINETSYEFIIQKGDSIEEIASKLADADIIRSRIHFIWYGKLFGKTSEVKFGLHTVSPDMNMKELYKELSVAKAFPTETVSVVIPEGFNIRQIAKRLEEKGIVEEKSFLAVAKEGNFDFWFLEDVPNYDDPNFYRLEGFLFPATYEFKPYSTAEEVVNTMLKRFEFSINPYREIIENSSRNVFDIIRLASIVEREAVVENERTTIAGVFYNRLEMGMMLQSCATVQYLFEQQRDIVTFEDLKIDSEFNTYKYKGLPLGAISNPGESSIKASIYPNENDYLFFVAVGNTGEHKFAKTFEAHEDNIRKYRD
ncbi:MAG: endolytic transglycosylase MltG [Alkaliphilus sp.]|nr:endolytic transglycosylase MltG [Alkaliphilus sp.]